MQRNPAAAARTAAPRAPEGRAAGAALPLAAAAFLVALVIPVIVFLGPLRLSLYRVVLLLLLVPVLVALVSGRAGRLRTPDIAVLLLCLWVAVSYGALHGAATAVEAGGIFFIETAGSWFLARTAIRSPEQFRAMARLLFLIVLALLPFALVETLTGRNLILETVRRLAPTYPLRPMEPRLGFHRVQGPFDHVILFGVFCGATISLAWFVLGHGRSLAGRLLRAGAMFGTAFLSLSSGPLAGMVAQGLLIGWNQVFRAWPGRWKALLALVAGAVLLIEILARRSTPQIFISYFAFSASTAWNRLAIWDWGSASVLRHPLLGIGLGDWERAPWMTASVDMFWLVPAMRHGLPAAFFLALLFLSPVLAVALRRGLPPPVAEYRLGWLLTMTGFFLAGWTVHYWNATFALFVFLLGSGVWMLDTPAGPAGTVPPGGAPREGPREGPPRRRTVL